MTQRLRSAGLLAAAVVFICLPSVVAPQTADQDTASVSLTVESYCSVAIQDDPIIMTTVTEGWLGNNYKTTGSTLVDVIANFAATLQAPTQVTLSDGASYVVDCDVSLTGENQAYYSGGGAYVNLDFDPGDHTGLTTLQVSHQKIWSYSDPADTYTGTVTVDLFE